MSNLKAKTKKGLVWSAFERFGTQGVQFLFSILLARLLAPEDYGIIAMPMIFLGLAQVFIDSGFANALVRKPDLTDNDLSTAFLFNVFVGLVCYVVLFISSSAIASFYDTPILAPILKITALSTLFNPLCTVQQAILTRSIDFKKQAHVSIIGAILGGCLGVFLAYNDYGVWALAISQCLSSLYRVVMLWIITKWKPKLSWSSDSFKYLWGFGSKLMLSGVLETLYQNMYTLVIGKVYSSSSLGYYTRAQHFAQFPSLNIYGILRRVTLPVLSSIQNDEAKTIRVFKQILRVTVFIIFPLMFLLIAISEPLIKILLTDKWIQTVPILQVLSFAMMWIPVDALNLSLLTVKGRSDLFLRLEIIKKIIGLVILFIAIKYGIIVLCSGYALYCIIEIVTDTYYSGKFYNLGFYAQIKLICPSFLLSLVASVLVHIVNRYVGNDFLQICFAVIAFIVIIIGTSKVLHLKEYEDLSFFLKNNHE